MNINTSNYDRHRVFATLYNNATPQGAGWLQADDRIMSDDLAHKVIVAMEQSKQGFYFDYYLGRVMKVDLSNPDEFCSHLYDRDNGDGAAALAIGKIPTNSEIKTTTKETRC